CGLRKLCFCETRGRGTSGAYLRSRCRAASPMQDSPSVCRSRAHRGERTWFCAWLMHTSRLPRGINAKLRFWHRDGEGNICCPFPRLKCLVPEHTEGPLSSCSYHIEL